MTRISQKKINDLNTLPEDFQTREELITALVESPDVVKIWKSSYATMIQNSVADYVSLMFMRNSWQLTSWGAIAMSQACRFWMCEHSDNSLITGRILINMGKIIQSPWYIQYRKVYVWRESTHFEMQMFDGNIRNFVEFYLK